jgi:ribosomal protein L44E
MCAIQCIFPRCIKFNTNNAQNYSEGQHFHFVWGLRRAAEKLRRMNLSSRPMRQEGKQIVPLGVVLACCWIKMQIYNEVTPIPCLPDSLLIVPSLPFSPSRPRRVCRFRNVLRVVDLLFQVSCPFQK